jgi:hypothetical protein
MPGHSLEHVVSVECLQILPVPLLPQVGQALQGGEGLQSRLAVVDMQLACQSSDVQQVGFGSAHGAGQDPAPMETVRAAQEVGDCRETENARAESGAFHEGGWYGGCVGKCTEGGL